MVHSPLIPAGSVDYLVAIDALEGDRNRHHLTPDGLLLSIADCLPEAVGPDVMANTVMLGRLAAHLDLPVATWRAAVAACVKPRLVQVNLHSLDVGIAFERDR